MKPGIIIASTVATVLLAFNTWSIYKTHKSKASHIASTVIANKTVTTVMHSNTNALMHSNTVHDGDNHPHHCDEESYHSRIMIGSSWKSR